MKRRLIQLTDRQERLLVEQSEADGVPVAAHVRLAIDRYLSEREKDAAGDSNSVRTYRHRRRRGL